MNPIPPDVNLESYDTFLVAFSGGKDSIACVLALLEAGVPASKIELWHQLIDGDGDHFMDWPCTEGYCRLFATAFGLKIFFQFKMGGFEGEMLRENAWTRATQFETPEGWAQAGGKDKNPNHKSTRLQFPQVTPDLSKRYCSAYLKIDVMSSAIRNQSRFQGKRTMVVTGERAAESAGRAHYNVFEIDRADSNTRRVDHLRPIHSWSETEVWRIFEKHLINPHPSYRLGYSRCSCMFCIFGGANQWASGRAISPSAFEKIAEYEALFGKTIDRDAKTSVAMKADAGTPYKGVQNAALVASAMSRDYNESALVTEWVLPLGAFGNDKCGAE